MRISLAGIQFQWNIDANVGLHSPNHPEDVQLVQFGCFAASLSLLGRHELRPIYAAVRPGAVYSGGQNDPLTLAILAYERVAGGPQDGHVSVIRGDGFYDGRHFSMLASLGIAMIELMPSEFPRLDAHPNCPPLLGAAVKGFFSF